MKAGSLFAGVGGFDLALERAGAEVVWQVEIDSRCREVLARHWPDVPRYEDVRDVGAAQLAPVDIIVGGFPCQDLSVAGRRAGLAGDRSGLFYEFARLLSEIHPTWVVIENVPGLLSSDGGRDMGIVLGTLGELGYGFAYRVLDAQHFGVPQRRRRVFLVGHLGEPWSAPAQVLFEPESLCGNPPPRRAPREDLAGTLGGGAGERGGAPDTDRMTFLPTAHPYRGEHTANALTAKQGYRLDPTEETLVATPIGFRPTDGLGMSTYEDLSPTLKVGSGLGIPSGPAVLIPGGTTQVAHTLSSEGADASEDGTGRGTPLVVQPVAYRKATRPHGAEGTGLEDERWEEADRIDTLAGHGTTTATAIVEDIAVRRLTPLECERLQGFPDGHTAGQQPAAGGRDRLDSTRYRQLGNAVAVPVAEWVARRIVAWQDANP